MWYRVFGTNDNAIEPETLLEHLHGNGWEATGHFRGDDRGWFRAELVLGDEGSIELERYLTDEEDIRDQLNTWAAWLETVQGNPHRDRLMQHMIRTTQLFTLPSLREYDEEVYQLLAQFLARKTAGVYQADGQGFFDPNGALLVEE